MHCDGDHPQQKIMFHRTKPSGANLLWFGNEDQLMKWVTLFNTVVTHPWCNTL